MKPQVEYVKAALKKVGIDVVVRASADFPTWAKRMGTMDFDLSWDTVFNQVILLSEYTARTTQPTSQKEFGQILKAIAMRALMRSCKWQQLKRSRKAQSSLF